MNVLYFLVHSQCSPIPLFFYFHRLQWNSFTHLFLIFWYQGSIYTFINSKFLLKAYSVLGSEAFVSIFPHLHNLDFTQQSENYIGIFTYFGAIIGEIYHFINFNV